MFHFRTNTELKNLMDRTAEQCGVSIQHLIRCCVRSFNKLSADVVTINEKENYYKSGEEVLAVPGIEFSGDMEQFRQHIADRCRKALDVPQKPAFKTNMVEGVDYFVVGKEEV